MTRRTGWAALAAALAAAYGCGGPPAGGSQPPGEARPDSAATAVSGDSAPAVPSTPGTPDTLPHPAEVSPTPGSDTLPLIPLHEILSGGAEVGRRVRVRGVCIGYSRVLAGGPQPRTRSDWQLADDSVAVWVVGPYPPGCSGTVPAEQAGTFTFVVASDTLPALGSAPSRPRVYLIHMPPQ